MTHTSTNAMAIVLDELGPAENLKARQLAVPAPGPDQVQVRQTAIGVNFVDVYFRTGLHQTTDDPIVLGLEGAGVVSAVGAGVSGFAVGDRVAYAGMPLGAYAELRNLPASRLAHLPDGISDALAASCLVRAVTAHMLLFKVGRVQKEDWLLVHAGAGGLGQMLTRWAVRLGAHVISTVGSPAKADISRAAGAELVVDRSASDWTDQVRAATDGQGVHLAVDGIGGAVLARTLETVRPFGLAASLGQPAGPIPPIAVEELGFARSIGLARPSFVRYANEPLLYRSALADVMEVLAAGIAPDIGAQYPLSKAAAAHADLEAGRTTGGIVLTA